MSALGVYKIMIIYQWQCWFLFSADAYLTRMNLLMFFTFHEGEKDFLILCGNLLTVFQCLMLMLSSSGLYCHPLAPDRWETQVFSMI